MKKRIILIGALILCVCIIFVFVIVNRDNRPKPKDLIWNESEFDEEWSDEDYYQKDKTVSHDDSSKGSADSKILYTYEDVYIYYEMLEQKKDELYQRLLAIYIIGNPKQLHHQGYAAYLGDLGREFVLECQRFQSVRYSGSGDRNLENHILRYHEFYGANECYYTIGKELIRIEDNLNHENYKKVSESMDAIHDNIKEIEELRHDG